MKAIYVACDGEQFTNKKACEEYERNLTVAKREHDRAKEAIVTLRDYCKKLHQKGCYNCVFKSNCYYREDDACAPMDWE